MYVLNINGLLNIDKLLGVKKKTIYQYTNIKQTSYHRWRQNGDLPLVSLISICNNLHLPVSLFITTLDKNDKPYIPDEVMAMVPTMDNRLLPITFQLICIQIRKILTDLLNYQGYSKEELCKLLNCNNYDIAVWFRDDGQSTLMVSTFLKIINLFHVSPSAYIHDRNCPIPLEHSYSKTILSPTQTLRQQIKILQERLYDLERRV